MKIKLIIVNAFDTACNDSELHYFIDSGHIDKWVYSGEGSSKLIQTIF